MFLKRNRKNIDRVKKEFDNWLDDVWFEGNARTYYANVPGEVYSIWSNPEHEHHKRLQTSVQKLQKAFGKELSTVAADAYFRWEDLRNELIGKSNHYARYWTSRRILMLLVLHIAPPDDLFARVEDCVVYTLNQDYKDSQRGTVYTAYGQYPHNQRHETPLSEMWHIIDQNTGEESTHLLFKLMTGRPFYDRDRQRSAIFNRYARPHTIHIKRLWEAELLTQRVYDDIVAHHPQMHRSVSMLLKRNTVDEKFPQEFIDIARTMHDDRVERARTDLSEVNIQLLIYTQTINGSRWLLQAADIIRDEKLKTLKHEPIYSNKRLNVLVTHLANSRLDDIQTDADYTALCEQLQTKDKAVLEKLLPVTETGYRAILDVLEIPQATSLVAYLWQLRKDWTNLPNSDDETLGVLDLDAWKNIVDSTGEDLTKKLLKKFKTAKAIDSGVIFLLGAALGWEDRAKVEKHLEKRNQKYLRIYGILPLRDEHDALERYQFIKQYIKEAKKFGSERQKNEKAAAQAALLNLAQVANYPDLMRMEWAMERQISEGEAAEGRTWHIDDYTVELIMTADSADLNITRNGKTLKSRPKAVRQSEQYESIKAALETAREQIRRFRHAFENYMATAEIFRREDLELLVTMPAASNLLGRLLLRLENGMLGVFLPDDMAIHTLTDAQIPISETVTIAHVYDLFQAGQLAEWQRYLVKQRIVQPFKQVFRELYVVTPAERETDTYSNRFAGHAVSSSVASRLLQARDWLVKNGEGEIPCKKFRTHGIEAWFRFTGVWHYFTENPINVTDQIQFVPYGTSRYGVWRRDIDYVRMDDVPPIIFSEVMRDADLVVSVAQRGDGEAMLSNENYERRRELVVTLLDDLGLEGVRVEGHFAYVKGKKANYRVHLGSAVIHFDPGNYLCIVPDNWGRSHPKLFLPFVDTQDAKISEVISKILLLLADDKIKDPSILRQYRNT